MKRRLLGFRASDPDPTRLNGTPGPHEIFWGVHATFAFEHSYDWANFSPARSFQVWLGSCSQSVCDPSEKPWILQNFCGETNGNQYQVEPGRGAVVDCRRRNDPPEWMDLISHPKPAEGPVLFLTVME